MCGVLSDQTPEKVLDTKNPLGKRSVPILSKTVLTAEKGWNEGRAPLLSTNLTAQLTVQLNRPGPLEPVNSWCTAGPATAAGSAIAYQKIHR